MDDDNAARMQAQLQALRDSYAAQLPEKIQQIWETWSALQNGWSDEYLLALHRMAHGLTGSGATFGFTRLSVAARTLEIFLKGLIAESKVPLALTHCGEIERYLNALHNASLKADEESLPPGKSARTKQICDATNRQVFLVEDNRQLAESLALQIGYFSFNVSIFATLGEACQAIRQAAPAALILDIPFPDGVQDGAHLLGEISQQRGHVIPTFYISAHHELEYRLQAVRAGGCAYFTKPLDFDGLIDKLEEVTSCECEEPYRILIIDDSRSLTDEYAAILNGAGMATECVSNPLEVMEPLQAFKPDLILMDVYMPQCSGLELAMVIRQQERFVSIPIVFLSAESDMEKQLEAMSLGGDDFLTKPIQPEHLVSSVTTRVQRARVLRALMVRDGLTGLFNHTSIKEQLNIQLARVKRLGGKLAFAMLDIDHFKSVNDSYGHPTGDRVIHSLSRLLQQRLRTSDVIGRYGGEEFAVIFNDTDGTTAVKVLDDIRHDFSLINHFHEKGEFSVTVSAGVADFPAIDDPAALNEAADKALYEAKHGGRNRVVLSHT